MALFHFAAVWPTDNRLALVDLRGFPNFTDTTPYFYFGFVGVQIFFVISGYVIAASCQGRSAREFVIGRAVRLFPILWIATALGAIILLAYGGPPTQILIRAFTSATIWPLGPWIDVVVWTLVIEVIFYALVWATLITKWGQGGQRLIFIAKVLAVLSLINLLAATGGYKIGNLIPKLLLLEHGGYFALGIFIWAWTTGRVRPGIFIGLAFASCCLEIMQYIWANNAVAGTDFSVAPPLIVWLIGVAVIVIGASKPSLSVPPIVRSLGLMTYPIYLIHQTVGGAVIGLTSEYLQMNRYWALSCGMLAILVVAWLMVEILEPLLKPGFMRMANKLIPNTKPLKPAVET